jgi:hypothetical protein
MDAAWRRESLERWAVALAVRRPPTPIPGRIEQHHQQPYEMAVGANYRFSPNTLERATVILVALT